MTTTVRVGVVLCGLICAMTLASAQPAVRIGVTFSRPLAVFHYVRQLAPKARANPYKAQFEASRFATAENLALLRSFESVQSDYEYGYPQYPDGKIEGSTTYILKRNLILASSLADFQTRSIVDIPSADLNRKRLIVANLVTGDLEGLLSAPLSPVP